MSHFIPLLLFAATVFKSSVALEASDWDQPVIVVHRPQHLSVSRTQSLIVEFDVLNFIIPEDGFSVVSIDGNFISQFDSQQVSLAVPLLSEGLHALDITLVDHSGKPNGFKTHVDFQISTLWEFNLFNRTEVFIVSPWNGQLLRKRSIELKLDVHKAPKDSRAIVQLDGVEIWKDGLEYPFKQFFENVEKGQHQLHVVIVDAFGSETEASATIQFEIQDEIPALPDLREVTMKDLCVGVLVSMGPTTLFNTLESYRNRGFIDDVGELIVFVQSQDPLLWQVAEEFTTTVVGFPAPIGKGNAWRYMADTCRKHFIVFVEEDFELVESRNKTVDQSLAAMKLLHSGSAQLVRMRSRKQPGEPLWAERSYIDTGFIDDTHLLHYVHFWNHLHVRYPDRVSLCHRYPMVLCAKSAYADYTNNPVMYSVPWLRSSLADLLSRDDFNTMERRMRFSGWWAAANITVGHGDGLFMHNRVDRNDDEEGSVADLLSRKKIRSVEVPAVRRVRVAFVHHAMWMGGVERQILFMCRRIDRAQAELDLEIVLFMERGQLAGEYEALGLKITVFPIYNPDWSLRRDAAVRRREMAKYLKSFDIVHAWYGGGDLGSYSTFPTQIAHEAGVHSLINMAWTVPVVDPTVAVAVMENDRLMEIHSPVTRIYCHAPGVDLPAFIRIDVGVDLEAFPFVDRSHRSSLKIVVGRISRLVPEKDPETFLEAAHLILGERNDIRFVMWGDGSERAGLERRARELGMSEEDFRFGGMTDAVPAALEEMDIFAYPTLGDSVGWVMLEAMASGLPLVSTQIDAVPTFVHHNENGFLIDIRDAEGLASSIMYLADNTKDRLSMGRHSRHLVETRFRQDRYIRDYVDLYHHLGNTRYVPKKLHVGSMQ